MKQYNEKCPICGKENKGLFLEETNGWLECAHCGNVVKLMKYARYDMVPLLSEQQIVRMFSAAKNTVTG